MRSPPALPPPQKKKLERAQGSQYLELISVNFSPATFFYAHRIFLDKVRPDNVLLLVFYTSN